MRARKCRFFIILVNTLFLNSDMKEITLVATGNSLITMKQSINYEPEFIQLVELIRGARDT